MKTVQIDEFYQPMIVVGDVHLGGFDTQKNREIQSDFIALVNYATLLGYGLILLGDIFDYWMEYPEKRTPPEFHEVGSALKRFINQKYWVTGNHDNWDRGFLEQELGFRVAEDMIRLGNPDSIFVHGDAKPNKDFSKFQRPFLHRILRNSSFIEFYQSLTGMELGWIIMSVFSKLNRALSSQKAGFSTHMEAVFADRSLPCSLLVAGHDHIPKVQRFGEGLYVNLGNFYDDRSFALLSPRLIKWCYWQNGKVIESTQHKI